MLRKLTGLGILFRPMATFSWSGGAMLLATGLALPAIPPGAFLYPLLRVLVIALVIQGWLAHSLNDRTDWSSGTDCGAHEYFSAGSGALRLGYLTAGELLLIAVISLLLVVALAWSPGTDRSLWLCLAVGLWGAIAYSCHPWRLSYYPLIGEWLAAFPAITACGLAVYQVLTGRLVFVAVAAAMLHGLLCVCWLMQHHLPDWSRDLQASPPKMTTIATVAGRLGLPRARLVIVAYFCITALIALGCSLVVPRFLWTLAIALLGAVLAWQQNVFSRRQVALREVQMIGLTLLNALLVGWLV